MTSEFGKEALKKSHPWEWIVFDSEVSCFLGGIPSGHSVLAIPLKAKVIERIFVGLRILTMRVPRRIDGERSWYSCGVNPRRNKRGSARTMASETLVVETISFSGTWKERSTGENTSDGKIGEFGAMTEEGRGEVVLEDFLKVFEEEDVEEEDVDVDVDVDVEVDVDVDIGVVVEKEPELPDGGIPEPS